MDELVTAAEIVPGLRLVLDFSKRACSTPFTGKTYYLGIPVLQIFI